MNKNFRVITINGIRGLVTALFIACGLIAGFVISPGWVCMKLWNRLFEYSSVIGTMNLIQGIMLWSIVALSLYAMNNNRALIGFGNCRGLTEDELKDVIRKSRENDFGNDEVAYNVIKELKEIEKGFSDAEIEKKDTESEMKEKAGK